MPRILIVDDDRSIRDTLRLALEDEGYTVQLAADGPGAMEQIDIEPPDLMITDVLMPGLTGWSLLTRARQRVPMLPVILISAAPAALPHQDSPAQPVTVFLSKPFSLDALLATIERVTTAGHDTVFSVEPTPSG